MVKIENTPSDYFVINTNFYTIPNGFDRSIKIDDLPECPETKKKIFRLEAGDWAELLLCLDRDANEGMRICRAKVQVTATLCADVYYVVVREINEGKKVISDITVGDTFTITAAHFYSVW